MTPVEWAGAAFGVGVAMSVVASRPKGPAGGWRIGLEVLLSLGGTVLAMLGAVSAARGAGQKVGKAAIWLGAGAAHPLVAAGLGCALLGIEIGTALRRDRVQHPLVQLVWSAAIGALAATVVLPGAPGRAFEVRAGEVSATVLAVALLVRLGAGVWVRETIPEDVVVPPPTKTPSAPTWLVGALFGDGDRLDLCLGEWEGVLAQAGPVAGKPRDHKRHDTFLCRRPRGLRRYCRRLARVHLVVTGLLTSATLAHSERRNSPP